MKLITKWSPPIELSNGSSHGLIYYVDHAELPDRPGIYIFGRKHGDSIEALYVGKASNLRNRVRGQLKNLPLMLHLQNAMAGSRILLCGRFRPKPGQTGKKCLSIIERAFIRHFLSEGHDLVNKQGTSLRQHELSASGSPHVPRKLFVEQH